MIIITPEDMWHEFVFYRKLGINDLAFSYIRHKTNNERWKMLIAGIAIKHYNVKIGDLVIVPFHEPLDFIWTEDMDKKFKCVSRKHNLHYTV